MSFKSAAIKVLKTSKKPIHYKELTKKALEQNLVKTSGATPQETMNAEINKDIRINKGKSIFLKVDRGYYTINPNYRK